MSFADLVARGDRVVQEHLGGEAVTYAPEVGVPVVVQGVFEERYVLVDSNAGVETVGPAVWLRREDLPEDPSQANPTVTIGGVAYLAKARQTDGPVGGSILLTLRRV